MQASWRHSRPETSTFQWPAFSGYLQTGSYIFRCENRDSYPHKCAKVDWIDSKHAIHERRWELNGNKITIFWNRGTVDEVIDVGEVTADGNRMKGVGQYTTRELPDYSWSATRRN